jgi:hypothetical protein
MRPAAFVELSELQTGRYEQAVLKPGTYVERHGLPKVLKEKLYSQVRLFILSELC